MNDQRMVDVGLLTMIQEALGRFTSDEGCTDKDFDLVDDLIHVVDGPGVEPFGWAWRIIDPPQKTDCWRLQKDAPRDMTPYVELRPLYLAAPSAPVQEWPVLDKPAKVGGGRFHVGVSSRLVVEAAQRHYEYEVTPEKEAARIARASKAIDALVAPVQTVPDWKPIETAPKDGTAILVCCRSWVTVGVWNRHRNAWCCDAPGYPPYPQDEQPTHWTPRPQPPKEIGE